MGILKSQIVSNLGLKGETPVTRENALPTSQLHYEVKPKSQTAGHSNLDLDGQTPQSYSNPEK